MADTSLSIVGVTGYGSFPTFGSERPSSNRESGDLRVSCLVLLFDGAMDDRTPGSMNRWMAHPRRRPETCCVPIDS